MTAIDPEDIKRQTIKQNRQIHEVQKYMEQQNALDQEQATGKIGSHDVKRFPADALSKIQGMLSVAFDFFKGKAS